MNNYFNKFIIVLSLIVLVLIIIPSNFAVDNDLVNETTIELSNENSDVLEIDDNLNVLEASADYYFDASVERDGTGTIDNPYKTLTANRIKANSNIHLANGVYTLDKRKDITNVNFIGSDPNKTVIQYTGFGFNVQSSLTLQNLTLNNLMIYNNYKIVAVNTIFTGGEGITEDSYGNNLGGAIYSPYNLYYTSSVDLTNCTFINNHAEYGGAIYMDGGYLYVTDCIFINNTAFNYGGSIAAEYDASLRIKNSKFINSTSTNDAGGAIYIKEVSLNGENIEFTNCNATFGAGLTALSSSVTLTSVTGKNNKAKWNGGVIYNMYGSFSIADSSFNNNSAHNGGAMFVDNSTSFKISTVTFINNKASFAAGAIYSLLNKLSRGNSIKDSILGNIFINNTAVFQNDEYELSTIDLRIGNGNYTMYKINETEISNFPSYYSLIDDNYVTSVKNQQTSGNCWAFTAIATLESCILKASGDNLDLSEEHMKNMIELYSDYGWAMDTNNGGYDNMPWGYYVSWLGPVLESDDLTDDKSTLSPLLDSFMHVQNIQFLKRESYTDNDAIKEALMKYGAVGTGIYYDDSYRYGNSYYYYGSSYGNHAVTIVGWDDNYSRNNFYSMPQGNGAWIAKNSWGSEWGKDGYFYVSYYDTVFAKVGDEAGSYTFILNDTIKLDKNYQYDIAGMTDYFYNSSSTVWYKNIFTATDNEFIAAASTYFEKATNWDLSVYVNNVLKANKTGFSKAGYYTIYLDNFVPLKIGDVFEIVFKINVDGEAGFPISESFSLNKQVYSINTSFLSYDGVNWKDLYDLKWDYSTHSYSSQVACIKAFSVLDAIDTNISLNISYDGYNPVNIIATVVDSYGSLVNMGDVIFNFNGKEFTVNITDGVASITHVFEKTNNIITATYNSTNYKMSNISTTIDINVLDVELNVDIIQNLNQVIFNVSANQNITDTLIISINDKKFNITLIGGKANLTLTEVDKGKYDVKINLNNTEIYNSNQITDNFTIDVITTKIISNNFTTSDNSGDKYYITLVNKSEDVISNKNITFILDGKTYNTTTDNEGKAFIEVNIDKGDSYNAITKFAGDSEYVASEVTNTIKVKTKIDVSLNITQNINDVVLDIKLNRSINETLKVNINQNNYTVNVNNGVGKLQLYNLENNNYSVSVILENTEDYISNISNSDFKINVTELKITAMDFNTSDFSNDKFVINLTDIYGNPIKGKEIFLTLNSVNYIVKTDVNGLASININLNAGTYKVSSKFGGDNEYFPTASLNTIIVKTKVDINISVSKNSNNALVIIKLSKSIDESLNVMINDKSYVVNSVNGRAILNLANLDNGDYSISAVLSNDNYISDEAKTEFDIDVNNLKILSEDFTTVDLSNESYMIKLVDGDDNPLPNKTVIFIVDSSTYVRTTDDEGLASIELNLNVGNYTIEIIFGGDDSFFKNSTVNKINVKNGYVIKDVMINNQTNDVSIDVSLTKQVNDVVDIDINGTKYILNIVNGKGVLNVNLDNGIYNITSSLTKFDSFKQSTVKVATANVIHTDDFITYYQSGSEYKIKLTSNNKGLVNKTLEITLNGVTYNKTTDNNGTVIIPVSLNVGKYVIFIKDLEADINKTQVVNVLKTIEMNNDVIKYYGGSQTYSVLVIGDNNQSVGAGKIVVMKINNLKYNVKTDNKGYATLKLNFNPGSYVVNTEYKSYTVSNRITIKTTLITKNISAKSKNIQFKAKLLNNRGKILKNKKITFKINGKTYKIKTNKKGIATLKLKSLKVGKYSIISKYGSLKVKNTISIKK